MRKKGEVMNKIGFMLGIVILAAISADYCFLCFNIQSYFKPIMIFTTIVLSAILIKQQKEQQILSCLIDKQTENYRSVLRHHIKTPVLAQIRALELLLKGNFGKLNKRQAEMIEMTLNSCKHSYKIIYGQLHS